MLLAYFQTFSMLTASCYLTSLSCWTQTFQQKLTFYSESVNSIYTNEVQQSLLDKLVYKV